MKKFKGFIAAIILLANLSVSCFALDRFVTPYLALSTYLGGSYYDEMPGTNRHNSKAITITQAGIVWIIGSTQSADFPLINPIWPELLGGGGVLCKFSPQGDLLMSTLFPGSPLGLCSLHDGGIAITGTPGGDFPLVNPYQPESSGGSSEAFLMRLAPDGETIIFSTFFGGSAWDDGRRVAEDAEGNLWMSGWTYSTDFPLQNPVQTGNSGSDIFVAKFSADGSELYFSTYFGGYYYDNAYALAVSPDLTAYIAGSPSLVGFPVFNAFSDYGNVFIARFSSTGNPLLFSTFFGGNALDAEDIYDLVVAQDGSFYVSGDTMSTDFPLCNPYQDRLASDTYDSFVSRFSGDGQQLLYSTYFGSTGGDQSWSLIVNPEGVMIFSGLTGGNDYPAKNPLFPDFQGGQDDAFLTILSPDGQDLLCSFRFGGSGTEWGINIAAAPDSSVWAVGDTDSSDFPQVNPIDPAFPLSGNLFVCKFIFPGLWRCGIELTCVDHTVFFPGDRFYLTSRIYNQDTVFRHAAKYIVLEAYGNLYFGPSWTAEPEAVNLILFPGEDATDTVLDFVWPEGAGAGQNLHFWGALVDVETNLVAGWYDKFEFSYSE